MANDLTKAPKAIILEILNAKTNRGFTEDSFVWGELPVVNQDGPTNTTLTVVAKEGSGYKNSRVLNYNRLHLGNDIGAAYVASKPERNLEFTLGDATTVGALIPEINTRFGIALTEDDVDFTQTLPAFEGTANETKPLVIPALGDSLIYIGSITLTLVAEDIDLEVAIPDNNLDGLTYSAPA